MPSFGVVALRKRHKAKLEEAEVNMLRFSPAQTRTDKVKNLSIRGSRRKGMLKTEVRKNREEKRFMTVVKIGVLVADGKQAEGQMICCGPEEP